MKACEAVEYAARIIRYVALFETVHGLVQLSTT